MRDSKKTSGTVAEHDRPFRPAKAIQKRVEADFEHKTDLNDVKKVYKNPDGEVIFAPTNFLTNPPKKGQSGKGY